MAITKLGPRVGGYGGMPSSPSSAGTAGKPSVGVGTTQPSNPPNKRPGVIKGGKKAGAGSYPPAPLATGASVSAKRPEVGYGVTGVWTRPGAFPQRGRGR